MPEVPYETEIEVGDWVRGAWHSSLEGARGIVMAIEGRIYPNYTANSDQMLTVRDVNGEVSNVKARQVIKIPTPRRSKDPSKAKYGTASIPAKWLRKKEKML